MAKRASTGTENIPAEASSGASLNETTPAEQRAPEAPSQDKISDGPVMGENGSYLPASYKTQNGNIRTDR